MLQRGLFKAVKPPLRSVREKTRPVRSRTPCNGDDRLAAGWDTAVAGQRKRRQSVSLVYLLLLGFTCWDGKQTT